MAEDQGKRRRPPYASAGDLQAFFDRMGNMQEPTKVDSDWVESFKFAAAQPSAIISVLKWLKIVDERGASLGVWDEVRIPSTRKAKLAELVRASYSEIFNQIDDVSKATVDDIRGAFIRAYKSGDPGRPITCFIALSNLADIPISAEAKTRERKTGNSEKTATPKRTAAKAAPKDRAAPNEGRLKGNRRAQDAAVAVNFTVEIPADWTEEQIRERYEAIRRAISESPLDDP